VVLPLGTAHTPLKPKARLGQTQSGHGASNAVSGSSAPAFVLSVARLDSSTTYVKQRSRNDTRARDEPEAVGVGSIVILGRGALTTNSY